MSDAGAGQVLRFDDREKLEAWLKTQPREVSVAIAARAALRVLPLIALEPVTTSDKNVEIQTTEYIFLGFWGAAVTYQVMASQHVFKVSEAFRKTLATRGNWTAASSVASLFAGLVSAVDFGSGEVIAAAIRIVGAAPNIALRVRFSSDAMQHWWRKISDDAQLLAKSAPASTLGWQPLWSSQPPSWFAENWVKLKSFLPPNEDWEVWIDWYEDRLAGRSHDEAYELVFATVPQEKWKEGPAAANRWIRDQLEKLAAKDTPPPIPSQGPGPHVEIDADTGAIVPAKPESLDAEGNNIARLRAHHPQLVRLARDLVSLVGRNEQPELHASASRYQSNIDRDLSDVDFDLLWGEGVYLEEAATAAARRIDDPMREPLSDAALSGLGALLKIHGPFILSSRAGLENLALANRYEVRPQDEIARHEAARELSKEFNQNPDIVSPSAAAMFSEIIEQPDSTTHPERSAAFKAGLAQNVAINLAVGATIGAIVGSAAFFANALAGGVAGLAALPVIEGWKKSKPFLQVAGLVKDGLDNLSETDIRAQWKRLSNIPFGKYTKFVLDNEDRLRRVVGSREQARWLHDHLDWLKRVSGKGE